MDDLSITDRFVVPSSSIKALQNAKSTVQSMYKIQLGISGDGDDESKSDVWVSVTGEGKSVDKTREYVKAVCTPEKTESYSFPGLPLVIFQAFNGVIKHNVEHLSGTVLTIGDHVISIQGSIIGVTMSMSKIQHLKSLQNKFEFLPDDENVIEFNKLLNMRQNLNAKDELGKLSDPLKKELHEMIAESKQTFSPALINFDENFISLEATSSAMKAIDVSSQEDSDNDSSSSSEVDYSVISISSDDSDDVMCMGELDESMRTHSDVMKEMPPTDIIKQWVVENYTITGSRKHFIKKNDLSIAFTEHFFPKLDKTDNDLVNLVKSVFCNTFEDLKRNVYTGKITQAGKSKNCILYGIVKGQVDVSDETAKGSDKTAQATIVNGAQASKTPTTSSTTSNKRKCEHNSGSPTVTKHLNDTGWRADLYKQAPPPLMGIRGLNQPPNNPRLVPPNHFIPQPQPPFLPRVTPLPPNNQVPMPPMPQRQPDNFRNNNGGGDYRNVLRERQPAGSQNVHDKVRDSISKMSTMELVKINSRKKESRLRPIVIDGSNIACMHSGNKSFSCRGIALCVRYFYELGHSEITCFVPNHRQGGVPPEVTDARYLRELGNRGFVKFTPSRKLPGSGNRVVSYDDRFILDLALSNGGVVVSNDQYRDLVNEKAGWRRVIEERLLQPTFVNDLLMIPVDPLGKYGPKITEFLQFPGSGPQNHDNQQQGYAPMPQPVPRAAPQQMARAAPQQMSRPVPQQMPRPVPHALPRVTPHNHAPSTSTNNYHRDMRDHHSNHRNQHNSSNNIPPNKRKLFENLLDTFPNQQDLIARVIAENPKQFNFNELCEKIYNFDRPLSRKHTSNDRRDVYDHLINIFPNQEESIRKVLDKHPNVSDLNELSYFVLDSI